MDGSVHVSRSALLMPPAHAGRCVFAGIVRDVRGSRLSARDRVSFFPAAPLVSVTFILSGTLMHLDAESLRPAAPLPRISIAGPQEQPTASYASADLCALTIGLFPDAYLALADVSASLPPQDFGAVQDVAPPVLAHALQRAASCDLPEEVFAKVCAWFSAQMQSHSAPQRISSWTAHLLRRAAMSDQGRSVRQMQRRLRAWTGQSQRDLLRHARLERAFDAHRAHPDWPLTDVAEHVGFSDQSHMGREIKALTGQSPARIAALIESDERYWCYRLLGA